MRFSILNVRSDNDFTFVLLLELDKELGIELDFIVNVFLSSRVLLSANRRRVF